MPQLPHTPSQSAPVGAASADEPASDPSHRAAVALVPGTAAWCVRIAKGDQGAFAEFYAAWFDRAYLLARSLTRRDESFCLDVVQEAMLRVARRVPALDCDRRAGRWMVRVIHSCAIDLLRKESRLRRRERLAARAEGVPARPGIEGDWLREALAQIDHADRDVVTLRYGRGATLDAVGVATGTTGDAAHGRLRRVLARLRRRSDLGQANQVSRGPG